MADKYLTEAQKAYKRNYYKQQRDAVKDALAEQYAQRVLSLIAMSDNDEVKLLSLKQFIKDNFSFKYTKD